MCSGRGTGSRQQHQLEQRRVPRVTDEQRATVEQEYQRLMAMVKMAQAGAFSK
jgi:hypothetical protein